MYDSLKLKCKKRIYYINTYRRGSKTEYCKAFADGYELAYKEILGSLYKIETYIMKKTENPCVTGSIPVRGTK